MTTRTAYRSTHPTVLTAWRAAQEQADEIGLQRRQLLDQLGFTGHRALTTEDRILGVEHLAEHGPVPPGWRRDRETPTAIVPNRRTKIGADLGRQLDRLAMPDRRSILVGGMPHMAWDHDAGRTYWPGMRLLDEAVYVTWGCDPGRVENDGKVDPAVWERVKLSEYYAAVEATEAAEAGQ